MHYGSHGFEMDYHDGPRRAGRSAGFSPVEDVRDARRGLSVEQCRVDDANVYDLAMHIHRNLDSQTSGRRLPPTCGGGGTGF